jgi:O-phosphoseryl-tRNA(Sec) kinase
MKQFLLALCGLPASGKSILADAIMKAMNFSVDIVRTDDWRDDTYYTNWKPEKEGVVRQKALAAVRKLVASGKSVIHDDTNYYTSMRHELFEIAIENNCGFSIIHVTTSVITAIEWNRQRKDTKIPESVIMDIFEKFDNPGRRYLWDNADLEVDMETQELKRIVPEIIEILEHLEPAIQPKPGIITSSEFERLDVETRLIVSEFLEQHPKLRGNKEVSNIRRHFLRTASERKIPSKGIHELLWTELSRIL